MITLGIICSILAVGIGFSIFGNYRQFKKQQILEEENQSLADRVEEREEQMYEFAQRVKHASHTLRQIDSKHGHFEHDEDLGYFYRAVDKMIERLELFDFIEAPSPEEKAQFEFKKLDEQLNTIFKEQSSRRRAQISSVNEDQERRSDRKRRSFVPDADKSNRNMRSKESYGKKEDQEGENVLYRRNRTGYNRLHQFRQSGREK